LVFDDFFNKEKLEWVYILLALENDYNTIEAIAEKKLSLNTFDYDGKRYTQKEAKSLLPKTEQEIKELKVKIHQNDSDIYNYFVQKSKKKNRNTAFTKSYQEFAQFDAEFDEQHDLYVQLVNATAFLSETTPFEQIRKNFHQLKPLDEKLKTLLMVFQQNKMLTREMHEQDLKDINFIQKRNISILTIMSILLTICRF